MTANAAIREKDALASAKALIRQGKPREAFHAVLKLKHLASQDSTLLIQMSSVMVGLREFGTAIELIQQALAWAPDNLIIKFALCEAQSFGFRNEAVRFSILKRTNEVVAEPTFPSDLWGRASETFERLHYPSGVVRAAENAVTADPNSIEALRRLTYVYVFMQARGNALRTLQRLQALEALSHANRAEFANLALRLGDADLSLAFSNIVDRGNTQIDVLVTISRSEALLAAERENEAIELALSIASDISLFKGRPIAVLKAATLLRSLGMFSVEQVFLRRASTLFPDDAGILEASRSAQLLQLPVTLGDGPGLRKSKVKGWRSLFHRSARDPISTTRSTLYRRRLW
jgi:hypothetical protein